ncbi:MAG TPA: glycosyltransferase [Acidimicrobiales bacterium]|nr:glycosyltransferase [Acidimicrobiales bacterium]
MIDTHLSLAWRLRLGQTFDHIFVAQKPAVEAFASTGASVSWLPLAAPSNLLAPGEELEDRLYDVAFVGRVEQGSHREAVLRALGARFSIAPRKEFLAPAEMMDLYRSARTVVTMPIRDDLNMRVFEAAAARSIVLTTPVEGLEDVLPDGSYVLVPHDDPTAWADGVAAALASPDRQQRADAAYSAVRDGHTYEHRARAVLERLANLSPSPVPPAQRMRALAYAQARYGKPILAAAVPTLSCLTRIRMFELGIRWATLRAGMNLTAQCAPSLVQRIDPLTWAWTKKLTGISTSLKRRIGTARGHGAPSTPEGGPNAHTRL